MSQPHLHTEIDEDLQSRQLAVYGRESMGKLSTASILISGLNGLGAEIAKNVILANVKAVTLHDTKVTKIEDLSSQFYLSSSDVGKNRAMSCLSKLRELNPSVRVDAVVSELTPDLLTKHTVVVLIDQPLAKAIEINEFCRAHGIHFIRSDVRGLFGTAFSDFGSNFTVHDTTGEQPKTAIVASISKEGVVSCIDDDRIDFEDGDWVSFSEVLGMDGLNGHPRQVKVLGPYSFSIGDVSQLPHYVRGGIATQVKQPKVLHFKSLRESLHNPGEFLLSDFSKFGRSELLHAAFYALDKFTAARGHACRPANAEDAQELTRLTQETLQELNMQLEIDATVLQHLAHGSSTVISPMAAVFGGVVGQEVIKACTGKFHPLFQWFHYDSIESMPALQGAESYSPANSRYDAQIALFGREFQEKLGRLKYFLVGAGALGCEFLKNFALMGVGLAPLGGTVYVTDDDRIEKSNLSRQFLFRNHMIGQSKSACAAEAAKEMNADFNPVAMQDRVSAETEEVFNDNFWLSLDGVCNALDNVKARMYVDSKCVLYNKSLLESGTLGTKCNVQVVLPHLTENYGASADPPEKEAPQCTLHNFPHNIDHCLAWSRSEFAGNFESAPADVAAYLKCSSIEDYIKQQEAAGARPHDLVEKLNAIKDILMYEGQACKSYVDCIAWARQRFDMYFNHRIRQLTHIYPHDAKTSSGMPFWSPPKRFPEALELNPCDPQHINFIMAAANLRAAVCNIPPVPGVNHRDPAYYKQVVSSIPAKPFVPNSSVKIAADDKDNSQRSSLGSPDDDARTIMEICAQLPAPATIAEQLQVTVQEFEKDDDTNFHIDFIAAAANLRARNYAIQEVDRLHAKLKAGRIIPAIATATAMATGFVCLELYKIVAGHGFDKYRQTFANLALPLFALSEPIAPKKIVSRTEQSVPDPLNHPEYVEEEEIIAIPENFTVWDHVDIDARDMTLQQLIDFCRNDLPAKYGRPDLVGKVELTSMAIPTVKGGAIAYNSMMGNTKLRLPMKLTDVYETLGNQRIGSRRFIVPTCLFSSTLGETVEMPELHCYVA